MKLWENRIYGLLDKSLGKIPMELNELDWKTDLSPNVKNIEKHLSAFSNMALGGFLVFGIDNDGNFSNTISSEKANEIVKQLGNIANNNLSISLTLDHTIIEYKGNYLLIIYIPECDQKPVYIKGNDMYNTYKRSSGQTVKMQSSEVKSLIALSQNFTFEDQISYPNVSSSDITMFLNYKKYYSLIGRQIPSTVEGILESFINEEFIKAGSLDMYSITNLGAIAFAANIENFKSIKRKAPRFIIYKGTNKIEAIKEIVGRYGYAVGFEAMINFIMEQLTVNEVIEHALRTEVKMFPEVAIREFIANALVHQDFAISGAGVTIELFKDRLEITNPGIPLIDTNRFIGASPKSRNETLASLLRRLKICEERGSGVLRAIEAIEDFQLPAPKFIQENDYTKVILYAHTSLNNMSKEDRIRACYQHACLNHASNQKTNNESVRKRFKISDKNYPIASRIISETIESNLIKVSAVSGNSKKHATYLPYWA